MYVCDHFSLVLVSALFWVSEFTCNHEQPPSWRHLLTLGASTIESIVLDVKLRSFYSVGLTTRRLGAARIRYTDPADRSGKNHGI